MRLVATMLMLGLAACSSAQTIQRSESYLLLLTDDGHTYCGYTDPVEFETVAMSLKPLESARITYSADRLLEFTYQVEAESGDWIVVDKYTATEDGANLRRANLLATGNLQVIQEAVILAGTVGPLRTINVITLDGKETKLPPNVDFPEISIKTDLLADPFMRVVAEMRSQSTSMLCKTLD